MGTNVGTLEYDVTLDTSKLMRDERELQARLERAASHGDRLQAKFTAVSAAISSALAAITVDAFVAKLVTVQRQFDVLFAGLKTVTGGLDQAKDAFQRLTQFATQTPYSLEQSVQGFIRLKSLGLDPSERAMTAFGNTSSAMGKDLMQMIEAVADASTGEFERLKEFGIRAKNEGDTIKFTFQGVTTSVKNNASEITEYLIRIGEVNFAGAMAGRMKTLDGDVANLKDAWDALFLAVSQSGVGDAISTSMQQATKVIVELTTSIKDGGLTDAFDKLGAVIPVVEVAVMSLTGAMTARLVTAMASVVLQAGRTAAAMVTMTSATTAFGAAMAALGGPIGIAITAIGLLALNWDKLGFSAKTAADISEDSARRIAAAQGKSSAGAAKDLAQQAADARKAIKDLEAARTREKISYTGPGSDKTIQMINDKIAAHKAAIVEIEKAQARLTGKANGGSTSTSGSASTSTSGAEADLAALTKEMDKYATSAERANKEVERLKKQFGAAFTPEMEKIVRARVDPPKKPARTAGTDTEAYLADLRKRQASEIEAINITEQEELRKLDLRKENHKAYEDAKTLITSNAEKARAELMAKTQADIDRGREESDRKAEAQRQDRERGRVAAQEAIAGGNPVDALRLEEEQKLAVIEQYRQRDLQNTQLYEDAKLAIKAATADKIKQVEADVQAKQQAVQIQQLQGYGQLFGSVADLTKTFAGEQSGAYKAMFAVSKAFAIADAIIKIQQGIAGAASLPFPANLGAMATVAASTASIVSTISSASFGGGRQYGGPASAGTLYRVNETGRPEMFTASNGNQYMLPTKSGQVTAANKVGAGGGVTINQVINVQAGASYADVMQACTVAKDQAKAEIYQSMNNGGVFSR